MKCYTSTLTVLLLSLFAAFWLLSPPAASAANIVVSTTADVVADDEACSLREAIYAANNDVAFNGCTAGSGNDTIQFDPALAKPATFVLTIAGSGEDAGLTGDLDLTSALTISGDGQDNTIIDGNASDRVLHIHPTANVSISGLTVRNGNPGTLASGGGIAVENGGQLTLNTSTITNNNAGLGAGLNNVGASSSTTIENTQISFNTASVAGGGISNNGILILKSSTIDNNQATTGGGINHQGASFDAENVTISANTATDNGGGIANQTSATLTNVTLTGNGASGADTGGNIFNDGDSPSIIFVNTIVANPGPGGNCVNTVGALNSLGHNLESTDSCSFTATGDIVDTDPLLGPLQDNGGPTPTHALLTGSPAIDKGDDTKCPTHDQRGIIRPVGPSCDIGAFEANGLTPVYAVDLAPDAAKSGAAGQTVDYTLILTNNGNVTDSFDLTATGQAWNSALSTSLVSLAPSASEVFTVTVAIPPGMADQDSDTVTITATSQGDSSKTDTALLTTTAVATPVYGVVLSPADSLSGPAGGQVIYSLTVSNSGSVVDTFDLLPSGNSWTTTLSSQVVTLGAGGSQVVTITVLIPPAAAALASDQVSIQATSRHDSSKSDTAVLTTVSTGQPAWIYLPIVMSNLAQQAGFCGGEGQGAVTPADNNNLLRK